MKVYPLGAASQLTQNPNVHVSTKINVLGVPHEGNGQQYLQVDLRHDFIITGIATQGLEALSNYYVKRYKVSHSRDGYTWSIFPVSIDLT